MCIFFFFKQKTADEMRISDWSSDVCSSDLSLRLKAESGAFRQACDPHSGAAGRSRRCVRSGKKALPRIWVVKNQKKLPLRLGMRRGSLMTADRFLVFTSSAQVRRGSPRGRPFSHDTSRSEEHTSELQSLIRISYAVFCFEKKTIKQQRQQDD